MRASGQPPLVQRRSRGVERRGVMALLSAVPSGGASTEPNVGIRIGSVFDGEPLTATGTADEMENFETRAAFEAQRIDPHVVAVRAACAALSHTSNFQRVGVRRRFAIVRFDTD